MEFGEVGTEHTGSVAGRIAGDEDRSESVRGAGLNYVNGLGHFVEFVRANVGTVAEAKVDLTNMRSNQRPCNEDHGHGRM